MPGAYLWAWDGANWIKVECDINGYLKVDMSEISLGDLGDVSVPAPADGDFIEWDATTSKWIKIAHAALTTGVHAFNKSCRVYHSVDQAIPDATGTQLAFDSERWDTDAIHDPTLNNSRLTCKTAGIYLIVGSVMWEVNNVGRRIILIRINGFTYLTREELDVGASGYKSTALATIYNMAVNDYVELRVYQNSGGPLNVMAIPAESAEFMMARIV